MDYYLPFRDAERPGRAALPASSYTGERQSGRGREQMSEKKDRKREREREEGREKAETEMTTGRPNERGKVRSRRMRNGGNTNE